MAVLYLNNLLCYFKTSLEYELLPQLQLVNHCLSNLWVSFLGIYIFQESLLCSTYVACIFKLSLFITKEVCARSNLSLSCF